MANAAHKMRSTAANVRQPPFASDTPAPLCFLLLLLFFVSVFHPTHLCVWSLIAFFRFVFSLPAQLTFLIPTTCLPIPATVVVVDWRVSCVRWSQIALKEKKEKKNLWIRKKGTLTIFDLFCYLCPDRAEPGSGDETSERKVGSQSET